MKNIHLVISRYNEDIDWVSKLEEINVTFDVYNKGNYINNSIQIENIGRESHTYLYYIVNNYNYLPDNVGFIQGNPFDHSPNMFSNIEIYKKNKDDFMYLSENIIKCDLNGYPHHGGLNLFDFLKKIGIDYNYNEIIFGAGAQFIVSKEKILKHNVEFYEKILTFLNSTKPIESYKLERTWSIIFNGK